MKFKFFGLPLLAISEFEDQFGKLFNANMISLK